MFGKKLLERRILWRVGNGEQIRLTKDRWIPEALYPLRPSVVFPDDLKVNFLIDEASRSWNKEAVNAFFNTDDAKLILEIPLSLHGGDDFPSWPHTRSGMFTVKSAYFLARNEAFFLSTSSKGKGNTSNQSGATKEWKQLWAVKAPPKMKIVLWRFAHNCLPTGKNLKSMNITAQYTCCYCGREEDATHVFLTCQYASEVWKQLKAKGGLRRRFKSFRSPRQWLFDYLAASTEEEAMTMTITLWHIWEARNGVRKGEGQLHPHCIVGKIQAYVDMVLLHNYKPIVSNRCDPTRPKNGLHHRKDGLW
jgi:hypothetical protein